MGECRFRAQEVTLDNHENALFQLALTTLQVLAGAEVEAIVYRHGGGLFITPRPGHEVRALTELALADWGAIARAAEEK